MIQDDLGRVFFNSDAVIDLLYQNPSVDLSKLELDWESAAEFEIAVKELMIDSIPLKKYHPLKLTQEEFDAEQQAQWHMPEEYQNFDIAKWLLDCCKTQEELQRVGEELLEYQRRNLFPLLKYLKYLKDVIDQHGIICGVGRGSSVSSYVLYLIGIHKVNSLKYGLDWKEFLRKGE